MSDNPVHPLIGKINKNDDESDSHESSIVGYDFDETTGEIRPPQASEPTPQKRPPETIRGAVAHLLRTIADRLER